MIEEIEEIQASCSAELMDQISFVGNFWQMNLIEYKIKKRKDINNSK